MSFSRSINSSSSRCSSNNSISVPPSSGFIYKGTAISTQQNHHSEQCRSVDWISFNKVQSEGQFRPFFFPTILHSWFVQAKIAILNFYSWCPEKVATNLLEPFRTLPQYNFLIMYSHFTKPFLRYVKIKLFWLFLMSEFIMQVGSSRLKLL